MNEIIDNTNCRLWNHHRLKYLDVYGGKEIPEAGNVAVHIHCAQPPTPLTLDSG